MNVNLLPTWSEEIEGGRYASCWLEATDEVVADLHDDLPEDGLEEWRYEVRVHEDVREWRLKSLQVFKYADGSTLDGRIPMNTEVILRRNKVANHIEEEITSLSSTEEFVQADVGSLG